MRVAMIANQGDGDAGYVGERLLDHGADLSHFRREEPSSLSRLEDRIDLLVLLGSDWSVYDDQFEECVGAELELIMRAQATGIPILGICFGGQMISRALGLEVSRTVVPEIGWRSIATLDESEISPGPWFQFHFDRWTDANGVSSLATSPSGPQAYWYGRSLALQFHPEVTFATIERWCDEGRDALDLVGADFDEIIDESRVHLPMARTRCFALVDRFLERSRAAR